MNGKILIIDDEEDLRKDLATILCKEGFDCKEASNGDCGIQIAMDWNPDVVLCDLMMPGKNGVQTIDEIGRFSPECSFLVITAYGSLETAVATFRRGVSDYLTKPLIVDELLRKVRH